VGGLDKLKSIHRLHCLHELVHIGDSPFHTEGEYVAVAAELFESEKADAASMALYSCTNFTIIIVSSMVTMYILTSEKRKATS